VQFAHCPTTRTEFDATGQMIVAAVFGYGRGVRSSRARFAGESPAKPWFTEEPCLLWINAIVAEDREDQHVGNRGPS